MLPSRNNETNWDGRKLPSKFKLIYRYAVDTRAKWIIGNHRLPLTLHSIVEKFTWPSVPCKSRRLNGKKEEVVHLVQNFFPMAFSAVFIVHHSDVFFFTQFPVFSCRTAEAKHRDLNSIWTLRLQYISKFQRDMIARSWSALSICGCWFRHSFVNKNWQKRRTPMIRRFKSNRIEFKYKHFLTFVRFSSPIYILLRTLINALHIIRFFLAYACVGVCVGVLLS